MAAAAEEAAGAEEPAAPSHAPAPARLPALPEKRALADGDEEELPEPKRRRAHVAALDNVRRAAADAPAASKDDDDGAGEPADGRSPFSFHARGFTGVETTPKFGSFNPADELVAFQPKPPPPQMDAPAKEAVAPGGSDDTEEAATAEGNDGNSH